MAKPPYQYSTKVSLLDVSMSKEGIHKGKIDSHTLQYLKQERVHIFISFQNTGSEYSNNNSIDVHYYIITVTRTWSLCKTNSWAESNH